MSPTTNSDNGMMKNQQADDLGHQLDEDAAPDVRAAAVESPSPGLAEGAGAMPDEADAMPDEASEKARRRAVETARAASPRGS